MFNIEGTTVKLTRGDKAIIEFAIDNYTLIKGDTIKFKVYKKCCFTKSPVLVKEIKVEEEQDKINIELTPEDTKNICGEINTPTTYWYEVELNNEKTLLGYDDDGVKLFILYPEGGDVDAE